MNVLSVEQRGKKLAVQGSTKMVVKVSSIMKEQSTPIEGDRQNTDPQSMDYPNGLPKWTSLKWTTPKNNPNEYYLMVAGGR